MAQKEKNGDSGKTKIGRDAKTGQFISVEEAEEHPNTSVVETINPTTTVERLNRRNFRPCSSSSLISLAASPSFPNPTKAFGRWRASPIVMPL
jgi:hypothetical protein